MPNISHPFVSNCTRFGSKACAATGRGPERVAVGRAAVPGPDPARRGGRPGGSVKRRYVPCTGCTGVLGGTWLRLLREMLS